MRSELFAVVSTICFAGSFIAAKRGLARTTVAAAMLTSLAAAWVFLLVASLMNWPSIVSISDLILLVCTGLIAPGVGYWASLTGNQRLGPSIAVPLQQAGRPLLAVVAATVFLNESVSLLQTLGIAAIVAGGVGLSRRDATEARAATSGLQKARLKDRFRPGLAFPITAAVSFAIFDILVKISLSSGNEPTFAAMVVVGAGLGAWLLLTACFPTVRREVTSGNHDPWIFASGILFGAAALTVFLALSDGHVSVISPILASQPLAVFILSRLLLKEIEVIRRSTILFGLIVVAGAIVVTT